MSYILDALKKSDQERQQGSTPGLHTPQAAPLPERKKRPLWPYILSAALLLNGGILAGWLWVRSAHVPVAQVENRPAAANAPTPAPEKAATSDAVPSKPWDAVAAAPTMSAPAVAPREGIDQEKSTTFKTALQKDSEKQGGASAQAPVKKVSPDEKKKGPLTASLDARLKAGAVVPPPAARQPAASLQRESMAEGSEKPAPKTNEAEVKPRPGAPRTSSSHSNIAQQNHARLSEIEEADRVALAPQPAELQPTPQSIAPAPSELPAVPPPSVTERQQHPAKEKTPVSKDVPASLQGEVTGLSLSFLVYSDNAAERMVSINGKMMREGQEITKDLKLDEITPNGVILNYQGYRFHKNLF